MMKSIRDFWKTSPPEHKDYLFIYAWGAIWSLVYLFVTPSATYNVFSVLVVTLFTLVAVLGAVLGIWGLVTRDNLLLERFGVSLLMIGPLAYSIIQLGLTVFAVVSMADGDVTSRIHLIFFGLWPYLFLNKRRRQLKARVKLVKRIPLAEEGDQ